MLAAFSSPPLLRTLSRAYRHSCHLPTAAPRASAQLASRSRSCIRPFTQSGGCQDRPTRRRVKYIRYDPREVEKAEPLIQQKTIHELAKKRIWIVMFMCGSGAVFYISNLEKVPVSGRTRFNCYSDDVVEQEGRKAYQMIMHDNRNAILPSWDRRSQMVQRVMRRLIPVSGLTEVDWEVHVIESPECNAFVIPGGKVFVYSGILDVALNDDGLAAVLGHEIAHNLARHQAESMSTMVMLEPLRWVLLLLDYSGQTFGLGRIIGHLLMDFGIQRPASRKQEGEADFIGLMMMSKACFDPKAAIGLWERMEIATKDQQIPQWLSTHPSNVNRISTMRQWLPEAEQAWNDSECSMTNVYAEGFRSATRDIWGMFK